MDIEFIQIEGQQGGWQLLFQKLNQISRTSAGPQLIAKKPMNVIRNRYRDVLPIDSTRVVLNDSDNDYVNANHVTFSEVERKYILTQGPLEHTVPHFWQMVWENGSTGVVMLNKCVERGMNKCFPYWPHVGDPVFEVGKFRLENLGCEEESSYQLSSLKMEDSETGDSRVISHFHYTKWPDFGVPQNPDVFLEFLYAVRSSGVLNGPLVIHCSAGIGRTGTFCLVDTVLAKLEACRDLSGVNAQSVLLDMRRQRLGLIQTADQLRFSYIAILQGAIQDLHLETSNYEPEFSDSDEDSLDDSDSDAVESEEQRMERKYPSLNRQYGTEPPPLPPRPPETLVPAQPPETSPPVSEDSDDAYEKPPPPTSSPPGPPGPPIVSDDGVKRMRLSEEPPPVPLRNESLSPSPASSEDQPPPLPARTTRRSSEPQQAAPPSIEAEEMALLSELNELERIVANGQPPALTKAEERALRRENTLAKIQQLQDHMAHERQPDWSVPWVLVGFVAVLGYCAYYVLH